MPLVSESLRFSGRRGEPGQWIYLDFKTLRIEPTYSTMQAGYHVYLKSW
jgi:hypothetical protein